jgi:hypothetical protein
MRINYGRHFAMLAIGAAMLAFLPNLPLVGEARFIGLFVVVGALYGTAIVLALTPLGGPLKMIAFVTVSAALSVLSPTLGIQTAALLGGAGLGLAFMLASAIGAASYWHVVRWFWVRDLPHDSLWAAVFFCTIATPLAFLLAAAIGGFGAATLGLRGAISDAVPSVAWWMTFSLVLYYFDARKRPSAPACKA